MAQWQCLLCFAVVAASVAASLGAIIIRTKNRLPPHTDGTAAPPPPWTSCWSGVRPAWLLAFRATAAAALAAVLAWDVRTYDPSIMMYYTEWTPLLEIAYFTVAALCSAYGCLTMYAGSRADDDDPESNNGRLLCRSRSGDDAPINASDDAWAGADGRLGRLMRIGYQTSAGAVVLTDVVLWGVIVPFMSSAHFSLNAVMGCIHSLNLVFLLTETALKHLGLAMDRNGLLHSLDMPVRDRPVDRPCLWLGMVALPFSQPYSVPGTIVVSRHGIAPSSMLPRLLADCEGKELRCCSIHMQDANMSRQL